MPVAKKAALTRQPAPHKKADDVTALPAVPEANDRAAKTVSIEKAEATAQPRDRVEAAYRKVMAAANQGRINEALDAFQRAHQTGNLSRELMTLVDQKLC